MARRNPWISPKTGQPISEDYEKRLRRRGIGRREFESGRVSSRRMRAARGKANTPERPSLAEKEPQRYREYLKRTIQRQQDPSDRRRSLSPIRIYAREHGLILRVVPSQEERTLIGKHNNAVKRFLRTGDRAALDMFFGKKIAGFDPITGDEALYELETESAILVYEDSEGRAAYEHLYADDD